jgi:hypothetical protein
MLSASAMNRGRAIAATVLTVAALALSACSPAEPETRGAPPDARRLTEEQYRNIISDVFGSAVVVSGRFDTPLRTDGLLAVGARQATVTAGAMRQYDETARAVATQVLGEPLRGFLLPCALSDAMPFDEACASQFLGQVGRLLFRRRLTDEELRGRVAMAKQAAASLGRFEDGLHIGLSNLLVDPNFLFVTERIEPDPGAAGRSRLDGYSVAARLSFLLWNSAPDDALLAAAQAGELHDPAGIETQAERMLASPRLETGVRAFFSDMLKFADFRFLEKDTEIYPAFGVAASQDALEQTLRTIVHHVIDEDADYRDLFTTRKTFMTRTLGQIYRIPVTTPKGVWAAFEFPDGDIRGGIQSQLAFLALHSHPGRSSPTLRGKAIRNTLLCQQVPDPPPDVDFTGFNDPDSPVKTARQRLSAHSTSPACAGCHRITDPIGLALENFDGAGQFRDAEGGEAIDVSGDLDGIAFEDASGVGPALHANPAVVSCLVSRLYAYASGRTLKPKDALAGYLEGRFAADGYRVKALMERIATSKALYAVSGFEPATATAAR